LFCKFLYRKKIISFIKQYFGRKRERQVKKKKKKKEAHSRKNEKQQLRNRRVVPNMSAGP